jgi:FkbM family methyltransferase
MARPMNAAISDFLKKTLRMLNIGVLRYDHLETLLQRSRSAADLAFLLKLPDEHIARSLRALADSKSQLRQDLFVLSELNFKRNGFFVEFGATNGLDLSNTYLLEKEYGWRGILAEPARCWHNTLRSNRASCIDTRCVWIESGTTVQFSEVEDPELSTISIHSSSDLHGRSRNKGTTYDVVTVSLIDLLREYNAPNTIDFLSIDTEGSEYDILRSFDFSQYDFQVIACEHNFTPRRSQVFDLLTSRGYSRKFEDVSGFDDWYVKRS